MSFKRKVAKVRKVGKKKDLVQKNVFGKQVQRVGTQKDLDEFIKAQRNKPRKEGQKGLLEFAYPTKRKSILEFVEEREKPEPESKTKYMYKSPYRPLGAWIIRQNEPFGIGEENFVDWLDQYEGEEINGIITNKPLDAETLRKLELEPLIESQEQIESEQEESMEDFNRLVSQDSDVSRIKKLLAERDFTIEELKDMDIFARQLYYKDKIREVEKIEDLDRRYKSASELKDEIEKTVGSSELAWISPLAKIRVDYKRIEQAKQLEGEEYESNEALIQEGRDIIEKYRGYLYPSTTKLLETAIEKRDFEELKERIPKTEILGAGYKYKIDNINRINNLLEEVHAENIYGHKSIPQLKEELAKIQKEQAKRHKLAEKYISAKERTQRKAINENALDALGKQMNEINAIIERREKGEASPELDVLELSAEKNRIEKLDPRKVGEEQLGLRPKADIVENLISQVEEEQQKQEQTDSFPNFDSTPFQLTVKYLLYINRKNEDGYSYNQLRKDLNELGFIKNEAEIQIAVRGSASIPFKEDKFKINKEDYTAPLDIRMQYLQPPELNKLKNQLPDEVKSKLRVKQLHDNYSSLKFDEWVELNDSWREGTFQKHLVQYPDKKAILNLKLPQGFTENWYQLSIDFQNSNDAEDFKQYLEEQYPNLLDDDLYPVYNGADWRRKYKNNESSKFRSDVAFLKQIFSNYESNKKRLIPTTDERIKYHFLKMWRGTNADPLADIKGKRKRDIVLARLFDGTLVYHHSMIDGENYWTYAGKRYKSTKEMIDDTSLVHPRSNEVDQQVKNFLLFER